MTGGSGGKGGPPAFGGGGMGRGGPPGFPGGIGIGIGRGTLPTNGAAIPITPLTPGMTTGGGGCPATRA